jgi:hypothetical protein
MGDWGLAPVLLNWALDGGVAQIFHFLADLCTEYGAKQYSLVYFIFTVVFVTFVVSHKRRI